MGNNEETRVVVLAETLRTLLAVQETVPYGSSLSCIKLKSLRFLKESATHLAALIRSLPALSKLSLIDCEYESEEPYTILENAIGRSSLRSLEWTRLTPKDTKVLQGIIESWQRCGTLESLTFEYVRAPRPEVADLLSAYLQGTGTLRSLRLQLTTVPDVSIQRFANALVQNRSLESLVLNVKTLSPAGHKDLLTALRGNSRLKELHLVSDYMCTEDTLTELAGALTTNRGLEKLKLVMLGEFPNMDKLKGYLAQAEALRAFNVRLDALFEFQAEGFNVVPLFEGVAQSQKIESLSMPLLNLDEQGAARLQTSLATARNLRFLKLRSTLPLGEATEVAVGQAVRNNPEITCFTYTTRNVAASLSRLALQNVGHLVRLKINGAKSPNPPSPQDLRSLIDSAATRFV